MGGTTVCDSQLQGKLGRLCYPSPLPVSLFNPHVEVGPPLSVGLPQPVFPSLPGGSCHPAV